MRATFQRGEDDDFSAGGDTLGAEFHDFGHGSGKLNQEDVVRLLRQSHVNLSAIARKSTSRLDVAYGASSPLETACSTEEQVVVTMKEQSWMQRAASWRPSPKTARSYSRVLITPWSEPSFEKTCDPQQYTRSVSPLAWWPAPCCSAA